MDGTITSSPNVTVTDHPGLGTAVNEPAQETSAPEAASETSEQGDSQAGTSQERSENGQSNQGQGRKKWTPIDEIRDLRAWRREARQRETTYQSELSTVRQQLDELKQLQQSGPGKTARNPADFWQDPEARIQSALDERLERLEGSLLERFSMSREQEAQQQALVREQESAVEFIRSQSNYSREDEEDLIDIIESVPLAERQNTSPTRMAQWAWFTLMNQRGVGDRSQAKQRAGTVIGQPPGVGLAGKQWSQAEFDKAVDTLEKQGAKADDKLLAELVAAAKEGRVR